MDQPILLQAKGICKAFGPTRALINVDVEVRRGEIRGLIGENGLGKSTFSSIVAGAQKADSGSFSLEGKPYAPVNMVDAQQHGISMVLQEMGTIPKITVAANIFTGRLEQFRRFGLLDWNRMNRLANEILEKIGAPEIKAEMPINSLNFEDRKIVELARHGYGTESAHHRRDDDGACRQRARDCLSINRRDEKRQQSRALYQP